jgi:ribosomal protein S27AE
MVYVEMGIAPKKNVVGRDSKRLCSVFGGTHMNTWSEIGYVSRNMMCPKCGGVLLIHGDDITMFATCTRCTTAFVKNCPPIPREK